MLLLLDENKTDFVEVGTKQGPCCCCWKKNESHVVKKIFACQYYGCHSNIHLKRRGTDWGLYRVFLHVSLFSVIAFLVLKKYVYWPKSHLLFWGKASGNWCLGIGEGGLLRLGVGLAEKETILRRQSHFVLSASTFNCSKKA